MVRHGKRALREPQREPAFFELHELRGREVGEHLRVDKDEAEAVSEVLYQMAVPNFLEQRFAHHRGRFAQSRRWSAPTKRSSR